MPQTPTDPTKAQVWVMGEAPNQQLEFYFPRGAKGEPGGYTAGTPLLSNNLNDIKVPGIYKQDNGSLVTLLLNYPVVASGIMHVDERVAGGSGSVMQTFYPFSGGSGINPRSFYKRYMVSGSTWGPWEAYASQRISETAGRAIYTWDTINQRDQLIYGDTGLRNLEAEIINGWTASIFKIRRIGYEVTMYLYNVNPAAQTNIDMWNIPLGFRPPSAVTTMSGTLTGGNAQLTSLALRPYTVSSSATGTVQLIKYTTLDAWPTVLPGTANGTVPNL